MELSKCENRYHLVFREAVFPEDSWGSSPIDKVMIQ